MTPDQTDVWTDVAVKAQPFLETFGPGIALTIGGAGVFWAASSTAGAIHDRLAHRRDIRRGLRRLEQYADPNGNRALLDDMHKPRKEERP